MKLHHLILLGCLSVVSVPMMEVQSAQACTPAPDNPNGCEGINGGRRRIPMPVCLRCPDAIRKNDKRLVYPVEQLNQNRQFNQTILPHQGKFNLKEQGVMPNQTIRPGLQR